MSTAQEALANRLRESFADRETREVKMFGGISFMLEGKMVCAAGRDGDLLLRIDPEDYPTLITRPGAQEPVMGTDRSMAPGWIQVAATHLRTAKQLQSWVQIGLDHHRALVGGAG